MSNRVKRFHMAIGVDLIGSKTSMIESKNIELTATAVGIKMHSKGSNRIVVIPYSNVKGFELHCEAGSSECEAEEELDAAPKRRGRPPKNPQ